MKIKLLTLWKYIFGLLFLAAMVSCQEVVDVNLPNEDPHLVIEGYLNYWEKTPEKNNCVVTISTTGNYYDENVFNPVNDATVEVTDISTQTTYPLTLQENGTGNYLNTEVAVDSGHTYTLHVQYKEQDYEATGTVLPVAQLDSFTYRYQPKRGFLDEGYYLYFSGRTPKERGINYYRFLIYNDDSLYNDPGDYLIQDDEFLKAKIDTLQLANYAFDLGDTVRIEMYSLNKNVYQYYNELVELLFNDGGLFSSPPRNPDSNIANLTDPAHPPLGFFQVSTILGGTVIIKDE